MSVAITGRVYNAMMDFCGGSFPLMCCDGSNHVFATDSYTCMRWTYTGPEVANFSCGKFTLLDFDLKEKPKAADKLRIDNVCHSCNLRYPAAESLNGLFDDIRKQNMTTWLDIDLQYLGKVVQLAKAVFTELNLSKKQAKSVIMDTSTVPGYFKFSYESYGTIEVIVMPRKHDEYFAKKDDVAEDAE